MKRLPLIALAALPLTLGLVLAQQTASSAQTAQRTQPAQSGPRTPGAQPQPAPRPQGAAPQNTDTNYADVFLQKLAAQLGTTAAKLKAAAVTAGGATLDQAVKAGDLPSDRAAEIKGRLQTSPFSLGGHGFGGLGGPGMRGDHNHRGPGGPRGEAPEGQAAPADESAASGT
ncbi:hypothetical protein GO986_18170 [Deinococcus sp. HMF7620]|uniref:Uncharacterized protein n=1 Tax=Deinococcus arboris TaxID=2682977 RepID=A0A7C9IDY6_9DEIO|nr:hypothetical protein [Deinococcus arboris]MVN88666.1 hypothetical protein [Deinococcus arboris]